MLAGRPGWSAQAVGPEERIRTMLISQEAQSETGRWQGSPRISFAQLRRQLANPSEISDGHRQRLQDLAKKLARVKALGDGYSRVELSDAAAAAVGAAVTA